MFLLKVEMCCQWCALDGIMYRYTRIHDVLHYNNFFLGIWLTANGSRASNVTLVWMMNGTHLVVWMIIQDPLITVHCWMVCIFIFITQYLHVSCMALTATPVMNSERSSNLPEDGSMDFFHVYHLLRPCIALYSMGGYVEGSVSAQWIYCIPLFFSSIQRSTKLKMAPSDSDELWWDTILNLFKINLIHILYKDYVCTSENTIPVNAI